MKVLVATDGSDTAIAAARTGLQLVASGAVITLAAVSETPAAAESGYESGFAGGIADDATIDAAWEEAQGNAETMIEQTVAALPAALAVERRVVTGAPGPALCQLAAEIGADIVVIGSRGRGRLRRALLGSVSSHVVHNAPCAVLVVRAGDGAT